MKTLKIILSVLLMVVFAVGCKTTKDTTQLSKSTKIDLPFDSKQYQTDEKHFRSTANGVSPDINTAKSIAKTNAISDISYSIETVTENVKVIYNKQTNKDFGQDFDNMVMTKSKQILTNLVVVDKEAYEKILKNGEIEYTYWVVIEMNKDDVVTNISNIANNEQIKFDKFQFQKIFDKEMENYKNSLKPTIDE